jgi:hypothetical protein
MSARCWLIAACVIVLVQAVPANEKTPLEIDEQVTYYLAHGKSPNSVWRRCFEQSATPPLSFWLVKASSSFGERVGVGSREFWLRFPSLAAYLVSVWLVWRIVGRGISPSAGSAAALMMALHSVGIEKMALQARPYALGLMFALVVIDRMAVLQRCGHCSTDMSLFGIALAGLPWTHYLFGLLWLPVAFQVAFAREFAGFRGRLVGTMMLASIFCVPLVSGALRVGAISPALAWITESPSWKPLAALLAPTGFLAALAAAFASRFLRGGIEAHPSIKITSIVWLAAWIVLPSVALFGMAIAWKQPSLAQLRYILPLLGPMVMLAAALFAAASRGRFLVIVALVYSIAAGHAESAWHRVRRPIWHDSEWKDVGLMLKDRVKPDDLVFVQPGLVETNLVPSFYMNDDFQEYVTSRLSDFYAGRGFVRLALPMNIIPLSDFARDYTRRAELAKQAGDSVWLVASADTDLGRRCMEQFDAMMTDRGFRSEVVRENPVARVIRYRADERSAVQ